MAVAAVQGGRWALPRLPPCWPHRLAWLLLGVPLGVLYAALFVGMVLSGVLVAQGVGVLLLVGLLALARALGGLERSLARRLLHLPLADDVRLRRLPGLVPRVRGLLLEAGTWRTLGWLAARVLLGVGVAASLLFGTAGVVLTLTEPPWNARTAVPLLLLVTATVLTTAAALALQVRAAVHAAPRLLGRGQEERLEVLRETSQRLADRNRLARDLHDTIGHALTASLLQAAAARRTLTPDPAAPDRPVDPAFARQALASIEAGTRSALAELDRALAVLRDDPGLPADQPPGLRDLDGLLDGLRDGGLPVVLRATVPLDQVPPALGELAYRVVQEGTTNVLRHAGCVPTEVAVAREPDALVLRVRNGPPVQQEQRPGPGSGRGLRGLRERLSAVGGTLAAGPTDDGGFELRAELPVPR